MDQTKNYDSNLPLTTKFQYKQRDYEISIKLLEEKLNITLFLLGNEEYFWENTFTEDELLQQNKNWNIYEFKEYPLFIHDSLTKENFLFTISEQSIELTIWLIINVGKNEKKLSFQLNLISKKYDNDLLLQRFLLNSKKFKEEIKEIKDNLGKTQHDLNEFQKLQEENEKKIFSIVKTNIEDHDCSIKGKIEMMEKLSQEMLNDNKKKWNEFYDRWDKFSENIIKKIEVIQDQNLKFQKGFQNFGLGFSEKKTLNILHLSNIDRFSPTTQVLENEAHKVGITLKITENRGDALNDQSQAIFNNQDVVLVSVWSSVKSEILGNLLAEYVENGGNVVVVLFSCSTNYTLPKGRFDPPLIAKSDDDSHQGWKPIMKNHLLLNGIISVKAGSDNRRGVVELNPKALIDLVAIWDDGIPMMAVRKDLKGIITTLGFQCGSSGSQDGLKVVVNAMRLSKFQ